MLIPSEIDLSLKEIADAAGDLEKSGKFQCFFLCGGVLVDDRDQKNKYENIRIENGNLGIFSKKMTHRISCHFQNANDHLNLDIINSSQIFRGPNINKAFSVFQKTKNLEYLICGVIDGKEFCLKSRKFSTIDEDLRLLLKQDFDTLVEINSIIASSKNTVDHPSDYINQFKPCGKKSIDLDISNTEDVKSHLRKLFIALNQTSCKDVARYMIAKICPNKQSLFPYKYNQRRSPIWWLKDPVGVIHKEPDHVPKTFRISLLVHFLTLEFDKLQSMPCFRSNIKYKRIVLQEDMVTMASFLAKGFPNFKQNSLAESRIAILREAYMVSHNWELYLKKKQLSHPVTKSGNSIFLKVSDIKNLKFDLKSEQPVSEVELQSRPATPINNIQNTKVSTHANNQSHYTIVPFNGKLFHYQPKVPEEDGASFMPYDSLPTSFPSFEIKNFYDPSFMNKHPNSMKSELIRQSNKFKVNKDYTRPNSSSQAHNLTKLAIEQELNYSVIDNTVNSDLYGNVDDIQFDDHHEEKIDPGSFPALNNRMFEQFELINSNNSSTNIPRSNHSSLPIDSKTKLGYNSSPVSSKETLAGKNVLIDNLNIDQFLKDLMSEEWCPDTTGFDLSNQTI